MDDNEKKISELEEKIDELEQQIEQVIANPLTRDMDTQTTDRLQELVSKRILDIVWEDYFYYHGFFDSLDGWNKNETGAGATINGFGVVLTTGTSANDSTSIDKKPEDQRIISFDKESRFRTSISVNSESNIDYWLVVGTYAGSTTAAKYGFRLTDDTLYGVSADGSTLSTVTLKTSLSGLSTSPLTVEARLRPGERIDFYASDQGSGEVFLIDSITDNLPSGDVDNWLEFLVEATSGGSAKIGNLMDVEYIQKK